MNDFMIQTLLLKGTSAACPKLTAANLLSACVAQGKRLSTFHPFVTFYDL